MYTRVRVCVCNMHMSAFICARALLVVRALHAHGCWTQNQYQVYIASMYTRGPWTSS